MSLATPKTFSTFSYGILHMTFNLNENHMRITSYNKITKILITINRYETELLIAAVHIAVRKYIDLTHGLIARLEAVKN